MFSIPRFFFDANPEGGDGGAKPTPTTTVNVLEPVFTEDKIKELGFDSPEQAVEYLGSFKDSKLSEAEKKQRAEADKASFIKFASDENLMTTDDVVKYEGVKSKADSDLVFEDYFREWKSDNPDEKEEAERKAREDFNREYSLDSDNPKQKLKGESRIAKEAKELRSPLESKYNSAQEKFKLEGDIKKQIAPFNTEISKLIQKLTPDTLTLYTTKEGDSDVTVDVKITKEERDAIVKDFTNNKTFSAYLKDKKGFEAALTKKINSFVKVKYFDAALGDAYKKGKGIGTAAGSTTGAANPYPISQAQKKTETGTLTLEQSNQKIAEARRRAKN